MNINNLNKNDLYLLLEKKSKSLYKTIIAIIDMEECVFDTIFNESIKIIQEIYYPAIVCMNSDIQKMFIINDLFKKYLPEWNSDVNLNELTYNPSIIFYTFEDNLNGKYIYKRKISLKFNDIDLCILEKNRRC